MRKLLTFIFAFVTLCAGAQQPAYEYIINEDGTISGLTYGSVDVSFFSSEQKAGPTFYIDDGTSVHEGKWIKESESVFHCLLKGISARLQYDLSGDFLSYTVTLTNKSGDVFMPQKAGIRLGVDTYMEEYPSWLSKFFPTLLRNEKTHFYGYMQSPKGDVLGIVSPDPIASWSVDYGKSYYDIPEFWFYGHRIESVNLDLINALPLPEHNPQTSWKLEPGEERSWTISLVPVTSLEMFEKELMQKTGLPMITMSRTSYRPGEIAEFEVWQKGSQVHEITVTHEDSGIRLPVTAGLEGLENGSCRHVSVELPSRGQYNVEVVSGEYTSTAVILANDSWENVMRNARQAAWDNHQKPSSHVESWYGFHTAFLCARHFPDKEIDRSLDERFDLIYNKTFDAEKALPKLYESRIQNTSSTIGMLVDRFQAYGRIEDLRQASALADWLVECNQDAYGAYMNGNVKYTSVIYVAKSMMELYVVEKELGMHDAAWAKAADRHYDSIKRAIDELVASQGDFQTEGEMTFEDGMISCSALQVGCFALLQEDPQQREHYKTEMLKILETHSCLTQLRVNDARRRGGTMRFWEAQYDVLMVPNMFNSPHGWSAWRAYATYYAYLLTLEEKYLIETFNAAGAFANLIDQKTGRLRWAFVLDPYLPVRQIAAPVEGVSFDDVTTGNPHPDFHGSRSFVIGEQYVDMISSWQPINSQDNDVHEVFKFIEEAVLTKAYVVERADGKIVGYNCDVKQKGDRLIVTPAERQMTDLHLNLRNDYKVVFKNKKK